MSREADEIGNELASGPNAFVLHSNADLDCVGGSAGMALFYGNSKLVAPAGVSHLGKRLLERVGVTAEEDLDSSKSCQQVVLDAQDDSSIGYPGVDWENAIVIDHHNRPGKCPARLALIDGTRTSCCELVWQAMGMPEKVDTDVALCLMAGLLSDSSHLRRGNASTLITAGKILQAGNLTMEDIQPVFETADDQDVSRRISRLKAVQRMGFERSGEWVVATAEVGAFEAAACQAMLAVGADVAFTGSQRDETFRITGRANRVAVEAGLHLGEMFSGLAAENGGEGGGHDGAAGLSGNGNAEAMLSVCATGAMQFLKGRARERHQ